MLEEEGDALESAAKEGEVRVAGGTTRNTENDVGSKKGETRHVGGPAAAQSLSRSLFFSKNDWMCSLVMVVPESA